jgi:CheY-like chemotaxis protein
MPTALIVEDEPEANKLLGMLLRLRGYQTAPAFTGKAALEHINTQKPDVIFLDLMLPDLSGYEVCKILKFSKATSLIPLLIITARIAAENRIESFCLGADDYIAKPYTPDRIFQALDQSKQWVELGQRDLIQGSILFDHSDDGEILRRLGQLRSLLLARTAMNLEAVTHLSRAIKEIWCVADEWARAYSSERFTTLTYILTDRRLVLSFDDAGGWLEATRALAENPGSSLRCVAFNQVDIQAADRCLTLVKELPEPETKSTQAGLESVINEPGRRSE